MKSFLKTSCSGADPEYFDEVLERYPLIQHGVSLYLGSQIPLDVKQIDALKHWLIERKRRRAGSPVLGQFLTALIRHIFGALPVGEVAAVKHFR
ncbi:DUF692 family protein [Candidatus Obscuribacterales bacterium]|nr:DUF692 family protein [Candidatus Obscuribacterales bacterium]